MVYVQMGWSNITQQQTTKMLLWTCQGVPQAIEVPN